MKYSLNIVDRIVMAQILAGVGGPGSYLYHKELRKLREAVSFTEKNWKDYGMETLSDSGAIRWDPIKAQKAAVEIDIGDRVKNEIAEALKKLDKAEQLMPEHMPVYEKFIPAEEPKVCEKFIPAEEPLEPEDKAADAKFLAGLKAEEPKADANV